MRSQTVEFRAKIHAVRSLSDCFLTLIFTKNEISVHYYAPEIKVSSKKKEEKAPVKAKTTSSANKVCTVF